MSTLTIEFLGGFYTDIVADLTTTAPEDWEEIWLQVEIDIYHTTLASYVRSKNSQDFFYKEPSLALRELITEMHRVANFVEPTTTWTTCSLMVNSDGEFRVEYSNDPTPLNKLFERKAAWQKKHLGKRIE